MHPATGMEWATLILSGGALGLFLLAYWLGSRRRQPQGR